MLIDYIAAHQLEFWLLLGFVFLVIEVVTGFTTGIFLFTGLGALSTGLLMSVGILPETWVAGISATGISTGLVTMILWRQLRKLQGDRPTQKDNSSDLIGHKFVVASDISENKSGTVNYSGIVWRVEIDQDSEIKIIKTGQTVIVSSVEVGLFRVKLVQ